MADPFDVFISHNSKDKPAVIELVKSLQRRGIKVWLDVEQLVPGAPWRKGLEAGILASKTAAVLIGKDGLGPWEIPEMDHCLQDSVDYDKRVIPVLLPGAPRQPELPPFLKRYTWIDLRTGLSEEGLDRLEWGITGIKPSRPKYVSDIKADKSDRLSGEKQPSSKVKPSDVAPDAFAAVNKKTPLQKVGESSWLANKWWLVLSGLGSIFVVFIMWHQFNLNDPDTSDQGSNYHTPVVGSSNSDENPSLSPWVKVTFKINPQDAGTLTIYKDEEENDVIRQCGYENPCVFEALNDTSVYWKFLGDKGMPDDKGKYKVGDLNYKNPYLISPSSGQ